MSIKFLAEDDRPREKFLQKGKNSLSDSELLAIIMRNGNKDESALELSRKILTSVNNNWNQLSLLSVKDLMRFKGVGQVKAITIATALEIGRRRAGQEIPEKLLISNSSDGYKILRNYLSDLRTERILGHISQPKQQSASFCTADPRWNQSVYCRYKDIV